MASKLIISLVVAVVVVSLVSSIESHPGEYLKSAVVDKEGEIAPQCIACCCGSCLECKSSKVTCTISRDASAIQNGDFFNGVTPVFVPESNRTGAEKTECCCDNYGCISC